MVSFPPVSPPRPYAPSSPHPYAPHAQPISFFSILSPAQYWVRSTNHLAPTWKILAYWDLTLVSDVSKDTSEVFLITTQKMQLFLIIYF